MSTLSDTYAIIAFPPPRSKKTHDAKTATAQHSHSTHAAAPPLAGGAVAELGAGAAELGVGEVAGLGGGRRRRAAAHARPPRAAWGRAGPPCGQRSAPTSSCGAAADCLPLQRAAARGGDAHDTTAARSVRKRHTCLDDAAAHHCRRTRSSACTHAPCVTAGGRSAAAAPALRGLDASGRSGCTGARTRSMPPPSSCCVLSACVGFGNSTGPGGAGPDWVAGGVAEWRADALTHSAHGAFPPAAPRVTEHGALGEDCGSLWQDDTRVEQLLRTCIAAR